MASVFLGSCLPHEGRSQPGCPRGLDDERVAGDGLAALLGKLPLVNRVIGVIRQRTSWGPPTSRSQVLQLGDSIDVDVAVALRDRDGDPGGQELERTGLVGRVGR